MPKAGARQSWKLADALLIWQIEIVLFSSAMLKEDKNVPSKLMRSKKRCYMRVVRVLFFAANPATTSHLGLDEEVRAITEKIRAAEYRNWLTIHSSWAVRPDDLLQLLNLYKPQIVHFSGHGSQAGEIILVDTDKSAKAVSTEALKVLFTALKDNIRLVVLNACYSRIQAEAIAEVIDCVVGMNQAIGDEAAIVFAASFYRAIGFGRSIQEAFDQGKAALLLEGIPEEQTPELLVKRGTDPSQIVLLRDDFQIADGVASDWIPYEVNLPDGSIMVVLPVLPSFEYKALCIGKYPVTNAQYKNFVESSGRSEPVGEHFLTRRMNKKKSSSPLQKEKRSWGGPFYPWREKEFSDADAPVVCVSLQDANDYCDWVRFQCIRAQGPESRGMIIRLPAAEEWDMAAFGTIFPSLNPRSWLGVSPYIHHRSVAPALIDRTGNRSNAWGISDLIGNVWEWCEAYWRNPTPLLATPLAEGEPVLRGGSFLDDLSEVQPFLSVRMLKKQEQTSHSDLGFRILAEIPINAFPREVTRRLSHCKPMPRFSAWDGQNILFT